MKCMQTKFGGRGISGFGDFAPSNLTKFTLLFLRKNYVIIMQRLVTNDATSAYPFLLRLIQR